MTITNQIYFYGKALRALGIFNTVDSEKEKEKKCKGFKQPDSSPGRDSAKSRPLSKSIGKKTGEMIMNPTNQFMTDKEYEKSFVDFWGIRSKIAHVLTDYGLKSGVRVLDVPAGHGFFSYEIAKIIQRGSIHAVGLQNDLKTFQTFSRSLRGPEKEYLKSITYHVMDATNLIFPDETFDFIVNFLGLEDINMTRGITGVKQSLSEFTRVLKPNGILQVTLCLEGDEPDQVIAKEVMEYIGCNAVFYPKNFYTAELQRRGIQILAEHWVHTHRKMTASQAREELVFACNETPKIFKDYDVRTVSFNRLWQKFGKRIEVHGMAFYSDLCVLIGQKMDRV